MFSVTNVIVEVWSYISDNYDSFWAWSFEHRSGGMDNFVYGLFDPQRIIDLFNFGWDVLKSNLVPECWNISNVISNEYWNDMKIKLTEVTYSLAEFTKMTWMAMARWALAAVLAITCLPCLFTRQTGTG